MTNDEIGRLAEGIAGVAFMRILGEPYHRPLFRVVALGDKYPVADFLVDALDANGSAIGHCFVQVKGTLNSSPTAARLTVDVPSVLFNRLVGLPVMSYLLAVDVPAEEAYLVAAWRERKKPVSSVTRAFPLSDEAVKIGLHQEVAAYWAGHLSAPRTSRFTDV